MLPAPGPGFRAGCGPGLAGKLIKTFQNPDCPGRRPGQFGTRCRPVHAGFRVGTGPNAALEARPWAGSTIEIYSRSLAFNGDLWMWLQLMRLQSEVVRGPVGVIWGRLWADLGPRPAPNRPQSTPTGPWTTSNCSHMSCRHIHRSPITGRQCAGGAASEHIAVQAVEGPQQRMPRGCGALLRPCAAILCYAILLPGRVSGFRAGFRPEYIPEARF